MKKIVSMILTAALLLSLVACGKSKDFGEVKTEYSVSFVYADEGVKSVRVVSVDGNVPTESVKSEQVVSVSVEFNEGYKLAYFVMPSGVEMNEDGENFSFIMPKSDCRLSVKTQRVEENVVKKEHRFELIVIGGGAPDVYKVNDYYNSGDKVEIGGFRPNDLTYGNLTWSASDGKKYEDYFIFVMPDYDLTLTATYKKIG